MKEKKTKEYKISLKDLLEAGSHFGHQARRWNPKMSKYIFVKRDGVHIFDLEITARKLAEAMTFIRDLTAEGKEIVMVGTKRQAAAIIKEEAQKCGVPFVTERWLGGIITNWEQIKKSIDRLLELTDKKAKGEFKKYTKRENVLIDRDIAKLERFLGGIKNLKKEPDALIVVDVKKEVVSIKEAKLKGIKIVGIVDTNSDPDNIDYIIPANDDAVSSVKFLVTKLVQAYADGKALKGKKA